jgi:hypothetical protein
MATPPTFVAEYESSWAVTTTPKTVSVTVAVGDVLVIVGAIAEAQSTALSTPTGGGLTYTLRQSHTTIGFCGVYLWTATAASAQTFTMSVAESGTSDVWGFTVLRFSGSDGVAASAKAQVSGGAPSVALTTANANSAVVVFSADWNAFDGTSRTWLTGAGPLTEQTYFRDAVKYTVYGGFHADAGVAGSKTVGLSAPTGQKYSIVAVEVRGGPGPATVTLTPAAVVLAGRPVTPTPGPVTVNLTPAAAAAAAVALAPTPSAVVVALTPAAVTLAGRPLTATPGPLATALTPAVVMVIAVRSGGPVTRATMGPTFRQVPAAGRGARAAAGAAPATRGVPAATSAARTGPTMTGR